MDFTINFGAINLLVVFMATVASMLAAALWYSPFVLGRPWRRANNMGPSEPMQNPAKTMTLAFLLQLVAASLLAALLGPSAGGGTGVQLGTLIGFSFVFTALGMTNLFERRPLILILIHSAFHVVSLGLMGFIIGTWG